MPTKAKSDRQKKALLTILGIVFAILVFSFFKVIDFRFEINKKQVIRDVDSCQYTIVSNTQLHYDDRLSIGAGNFEYQEYLNKWGFKKKGWTASLWIVDKEMLEEGPIRGIRVYGGQKLTKGPYQIDIQDIRSDRINLCIKKRF